MVRVPGSPDTDVTTHMVWPRTVVSEALMQVQPMPNLPARAGEIGTQFRGAASNLIHVDQVDSGIKLGLPRGI